MGWPLRRCDIGLEDQVVTQTRLALVPEPPGQHPGIWVETATYFFSGGEVRQAEQLVEHRFTAG